MFTKEKNPHKSQQVFAKYEGILSYQTLFRLIKDQEAEDILPQYIAFNAKRLHPTSTWNLKVMHDKPLVAFHELRTKNSHKKRG